jgi:hypothetical protein
VSASSRLARRANLAHQVCRDGPYLVETFLIIRNTPDYATSAASERAILAESRLTIPRMPP